MSAHTSASVVHRPARGPFLVPFLERKTRQVAYVVLGLAVLYAAGGLLELWVSTGRGPFAEVDVQTRRSVLVNGSWLSVVALVLGACFVAARRQPTKAFGGALLVLALAWAVSIALSPDSLMDSLIRGVFGKLIVLAVLGFGFVRARQLEALRAKEIARDSA